MAGEVCLARPIGRLSVRKLKFTARRALQMFSEQAAANGSDLIKNQPSPLGFPLLGPSVC